MEPHRGAFLVSEIGKTIGQRIRELRTQRTERWTQEDLAERARISVSFLSMIERGERVAHVETLASLADALGVTLAELFVAPAERPADQQEILRPLSEFVRSRHLDSRDVEKLLGVARAMFAASNGVA
jgi:transcriptional regulator with XRE-family HTH domain